MPKLYGIIGVMSMGISMLVLIVTLIEFNLEDIQTKIVLILLFFILGFPLVLITWVGQVLANDEMIIQKTMFGKIKSIKIKEIKRIKFNPLMTKIVITDGLTKIRVHENIVGFQGLVNTLIKQTGMNRKEIGLKD